MFITLNLVCFSYHGAWIEACSSPEVDGDQKADGGWGGEWQGWP